MCSLTLTPCYRDAANYVLQRDRDYVPDNEPLSENDDRIRKVVGYVYVSRNNDSDYVPNIYWHAIECVPSFYDDAMAP